ncbi:MAG: hypothetical protein KAZ42_00830 [Proteocatella sp.]|nr:hypothetical protein [Proteocatella sp.]MBP7913061.1 hypothetical protein [Proteocatella sp.]MBP8654280.1 hypothetical protein [Proteocatella sp.]MBP9658877.1 hypothetical protein [Proteocatella sp.]
MDELFATKLKIVRNAIFLMATAAALSVVLYDGWTAFVTGIVFGLLIAVLCFELLSSAVIRAVNLPPEKAQIYAGTRYIIRLVIYAAVIFISIKADYINVVGTILGLSSIKLSIVISGILDGLK